jgi:ABC-2 type transport system permease protein
VVALMRASWLDAASYRMQAVFSLIGLVAGVYPLFLIAQAVQPVMGSALSQEGDHYFAFLITGLLVFAFARAGVNTLPNEVSKAISNGTLEALLGTPTRLPVILAGLIGYQYLWTTVRSFLVVVFALIVGVHVFWGGTPLAAVVLLMVGVSYLSVGIVATALIVAFRSSGPLGTGALWASSMLGGVYYPTGVIPSWLKGVSAFLPMTYGLRALRRSLLEPGTSYADVASDVNTLALITIGLFAVGTYSLVQALRYARRAGSLSQY